MHACYNYLGCPQDDMKELTGRIPPAKRQAFWQSHRMFFASPQTLQSDLSRSNVPVNVC